jgi:UDP-glucose 4-epimerase
MPYLLMGDTFIMGILVTGGAGYIGSHCVQRLQAKGFKDIVVLDNLCTGHRDMVLSDQFVEASTQETDRIVNLLREQNIQTVMHFAASSTVGESVIEPAKYYYNNIYGTQCLLEAMRTADVRQLIFSSSCAIYGHPVRLPLDEANPMNPVSPYGFSKQVVEKMLVDYQHAYGLRYVSLRYFNAAGADPSGRLGERHVPETHLIPLILQAINGLIPHISVFGTDYDTPDGTCLRDYIHVYDIADAHILALEYLAEGGEPIGLNIGTERGHSVLEVIAACERVTGQKVPVQFGPRRAGDPNALVASAGKLRTVMGWEPQYRSLDQIIETAWRWEQKRKDLPATQAALSSRS